MGLSFDLVRPLHITQYLIELIDQGRMAIKPSPDFSGKNAAFHDTCKLGRLSEPWQRKHLRLEKKRGGYVVSTEPEKVLFGNNGNYEAPRRLLRLLGVDVVELERNRAASYCCGATGGVKETLPAAAKMAALNRLAELDGTGANVMVSACGNCAHHLAKHVKGKASVVDLIDLLAGSLTSAGLEH